MNKKILFSLITVFATLILSISANAVEITKYEMNRVTNVITVEGKSKANNDVVIQILNPSKDLSSLESATEATYSEIVNTFYQIKSDENGKFVCTFEMNATSGQKYYLTVMEKGEQALFYDIPITYFSAQDILDAVALFNEPSLTDSGVVALLDTKKEIIGVNTELYDNLTPQEKLYVAGEVLSQRTLLQNGFTKPEEIINVSGKNSSFCILNRTTSLNEAEKLIDYAMKYSELSSANIYNVYNKKLEKSMQDKVLQNLVDAKPYTNCDGMIKKFSQEILLARIETMDNYGDLFALLENNYKLIDEFEYLSYKALEDTSSVDKSIAGKTYTITELASALNLAVENALTEDNQPSPQPPSYDGGSGGGGGGGSNSTYNAPITITEKPKEDAAFLDVDSVKWAEEAINALYKEGIISGKGNGLFAPNDNVTRGEFVKMIVNAFKIKGVYNLDFTDVTSNDWQYPYIAAAFSQGIINGKSSSIFGVNENITREDMAVILARVCGEELQSGAYSYSDEECISEYAKESVTKMSAKRYMQGRGNGNFAPKENATRAEAAKVIYTIMKDKRG